MRTMNESRRGGFSASLSFLAICLLASRAFAQASVSPAAAAPLHWAADAEGGAPYIFKDPKQPDRNIGYEVEIVEALAKELHRPIEFRQYDFKSLIPGAGRRDFDFAMNGLEITPDRQAKVRFSRPYYIYREQLVVRAGENRIADLESCAKLRCTVGTLEDTAAERMLAEKKIATKIYDGQVEPYRDLELGRLDAVLLDLPIAVYYAKPDPKLAFAGAPVGRGYYAMVFNKGDEALASQIDTVLDHLLADGTIRRIDEKWGIWNDDQNDLQRAKVSDVAAESARQWTAWNYLPLLIDGAWVTVKITLLSMLLAVALGLPVALARLYGGAPLRLGALLYVEFFRGIPVLLLLYFLYYGLPGIADYYHLPFGLKLSPLQAAILGLGFNYAAYEAEIYRGAIGSIAAGQWEAAASLGMGKRLAFRRIILPQAVRLILPPMTNDFVALFKDTSIVSIIAVVELSKQYQILSKSSMKYLEIGLATAALYLVMSVPLGLLARRLEQKWSAGGK